MKRPVSLAHFATRLLKNPIFVGAGQTENLQRVSASPPSRSPSLIPCSSSPFPACLKTRMSFLSISPSVSFSASATFCRNVSVCLFHCLCVCVCVCVRLFVRPSVRMSVCLPVCLFVSLPTHLTADLPAVQLSICLSICLSGLPLYLPVLLHIILPGFWLHINLPRGIQVLLLS